MSKKISMEDIARELGVSKNTVSLALRGMPGINNDTRQLIIDTAKKLQYDYKRVNNISKNICLIQSKSTRNSMTGFFNFIQFGIEAEARNRGLNVLICYFDETVEEFEVPLCIKEGMISGIITLGRISRKTTDKLLDCNLPLVMVDNYFDNLNLNYILTDNISSAYVATEYLIKKGHRRLGFIGDIKASISFHDRFQGFIKALNHYDLDLDNEFVLKSTSMNVLANHDPILVTEELSKLTSLPDAIFCCNDAEAIAVIRALTIMGINVPQDVSVIGFDDIEFAQSTTPELTTMRVEKEYMGIKAVERLADLIDKNAGPCEKLMLETVLIERNSVKG